MKTQKHKYPPKFFKKVIILKYKFPKPHFHAHVQLHQHKPTSTAEILMHLSFKRHQIYGKKSSTTIDFFCIFLLSFQIDFIETILFQRSMPWCCISETNAILTSRLLRLYSNAEQFIGRMPKHSDRPDFEAVDENQTLINLHLYDF